jgi:GMP synthase-like glutamine amidotransferase
MEFLKSACKSWKPVLIFIGFCVIVLALIFKFYTGERQLNGLLVDLDLESPDPNRHSELRDAITRRLTAEDPSLRNIKLSLSYVHFSDLNSDFLDSTRVHFVILSPQRTPWRMYRGEWLSKLESAEQILKELILKRNMPVLGICGGHQFLALTFGGAVDFIDPGLVGSATERYPVNALAERGPVWLQVLEDDPIFEGVARRRDKFQAIESHYEEVKMVPAPFINLARSELSDAQLIRIPGRLVYGMAFHPERGWDGEQETASKEGKQILANFFRMIARENGIH